MSEDEQFLYQLKETSILAIAWSVLICAACLFLQLPRRPRPKDSEMLLVLIIVAATVICSCAMFLHYLPSDADD